MIDSPLTMLSIDFSRINPIDFLEELGIRNVRDEGPEVRFSCPFPGHKHEDSDPSATMSKIKFERLNKENRLVEYPETTWSCFGCKRSGTALSFLAEYEGISHIKAAQYIRERFGDGFREPEGAVLDEVDDILTPKGVKIMSKTILSDYELRKRYINWQHLGNYHSGYEDYMLERGFNPEALSKFQIGYDTISNRISIPYFDEDNNLVGFKGRLWFESEDETRYKVLGGPEYGFETFPVHNYLFGMNFVSKDAEPANFFHIILVEGELNCVSMHQKGWTNTVGLSGRDLHPKQAAMLVHYADSITLVFDDIKDSYKASVKLDNKMGVWIAPEHGKDPAEMTKEEISTLLKEARSSILG